MGLFKGMAPSKVSVKSKVGGFLAAKGEIGVLAVDPGKTSGACMLTAVVRGGAVSFSYITEEWDVAALFNLVDTAGGLKEQFDILVMEDFLLYPWMAKRQAFMRMEAPKAIGLLEYAASRGGIPLVAYNAGTYKPHTEKDGLQKFGLGEVKLKGHRLDALRLAVFYLVNREGVKCANPLGQR